MTTYTAIGIDVVDGVDTPTLIDTSVNFADIRNAVRKVVYDFDAVIINVVDNSGRRDRIVIADFS